jgi:hypothetical protein
MSNAMYIGQVPEVFRIADRLTDKERMAERAKIVTRKPRIIPMPTIDSNPNVEGPLHVTQDFKDNYYQKKVDAKKKEKREYEKELMECLGKKERLQYKLTRLDPRKKKENKKIISINFQVRDLDDRIVELQKESGISLDGIKPESKLGKIWGRVKSVVAVIVKKAKKLYNKYKDAIEGVLLVALPIVVTAFFKKLLGL